MGRGTMTVDVPSCIEIAAAPATVWSFVHDPQTAVLTGDGIVQGFTMPGTPRGGVGERQCFVHLLADGSTHTHMIEVVELDPGHRAVTIDLPDGGTRMTTTVVGSHDRTMLTLQMVKSAPRILYASEVTQVTQYCDTYLLRVRQAIEGAARGRGR